MLQQNIVTHNNSYDNLFYLYNLLFKIIRWLYTSDTVW